MPKREKDESGYDDLKQCMTDLESSYIALREQLESVEPTVSEIQERSHCFHLAIWFQSENRKLYTAWKKQYQPTANELREAINEILKQS